MLASANNTVTHTTGYVVVNGVHEFSKSFSEGLITADITWLYLYKSQTTLNRGVSTTSALSATTLTDSQDGHFFKLALTATPDPIWPTRSWPYPTHEVLTLTDPWGK